MRVLRLFAAAGLVVAAGACGLDNNGLLGPGEDGGPALLEDGAPGVIPDDATITTGGGEDGASTPNDATQPVVDSGTKGGGGDGGGKDSGGGTDTGAIDTGIYDSGTGIMDTGTVTVVDAADAATFDAADACLPAEICNNGVDDNCDGKIDCADPECGAWTCTAAAIPTGWSVVEYSETARPACATGYGSPLDVVEGPNAAASTCGCSCTLMPGSCTTGNFSVTVNGITPGCSSFPVTSGGESGACSKTTFNYSPMAGAMIEVTAAPYAAGKCAADPSQTIPPVTYAGTGVACQDMEPSGQGCGNQGACVPATGGGTFNLCIVHDGALACPAGFTNQHAVGTGITDTRSCTACSCESTPTATCANPSLSFFESSSCSDAGIEVAANGQCAAPPAAPGGATNPTYVAYEYNATVQGETCGTPSPVSADGGVALSGPHTICCQ